MRFSLNLINVIPEMGNEYDEQIRDIDESYNLAWEIIKLIYQGKIELEVFYGRTGYFLEIDVPNNFLRKYEKQKEAEKVRPLTEFLRNKNSKKR